MNKPLTFTEELDKFLTPDDRKLIEACGSGGDVLKVFIEDLVNRQFKSYGPTESLRIAALLDAWRAMQATPPLNAVRVHKSLEKDLERLHDLFVNHDFGELDSYEARLVRDAIDHYDHSAWDWALRWFQDDAEADQQLQALLTLQALVLELGIERLPPNEPVYTRAVRVAESFGLL